MFNFTASNISPLRVKYNSVIFNSTHSTLNRFKVKLDKNKVYVDGILENTFTSATFSCTQNALLFARKNNANGALQERSKMRLYNCKLWDNGTLIRNFIPCYRNSDKEAGLYDLVNNVFYTNQGTGSFIKGNIVGITEKIVNKNWLDIQYYQLGSIDATTGQDITNGQNGRGSNYIPVLPNTTYTISTNKIVNNLRLSEYTSEKVNIQRDQGVGVKKLTITTTANTYFVRWSFNYDASTTVTQQIAESLDLQLEEGSTATSYVAHQEQNFIISCQQPMKDLKDENGNIIKSDIFVKIDGNWFEQHWIKTRILNGMEMWSKVNNSFQVPATTTPDKDDVTIPALSNYFRFKYYATAITTNLQDGEFGWNSAKLLTMRNDSCANETAFKTWLENLYANGTPVYINYGLAEPTNLPCTEEQTTALETYIKARTCKNVTHFYSEDETPAYQEVVYVKDLETVINQISNAVTALGGV